jgi:CMP/dCMP kinase
LGLGGAELATGRAGDRGGRPDRAADIIASDRWERDPPEAPSRRKTISNDSIGRCLAIDGPLASGKSVVGRALAERLNMGFFDTGLMYRACTLAVMRSGVDPEDERAVVDLVRRLDLDVRWVDPTQPRLFLDGEDVTARLREPDLERNVSLVSRVPEVRDELVRRQRAIAAREPVVMAGRDIGTRVLVEARTKIFLDASAEVRSRRRLGEQLNAGRQTTFEQVLGETRRRDELDNTGHRAVRREQAAPDAIVIDTDALGIDAVVDRCVDAYHAANAAA